MTAEALSNAFAHFFHALEFSLHGIVLVLQHLELGVHSRLHHLGQLFHQQLAKQLLLSFEVLANNWSQRICLRSLRNLRSRQVKDLRLLRHQQNGRRSCLDFLTRIFVSQRLNLALRRSQHLCLSFFTLDLFLRLNWLSLVWHRRTGKFCNHVKAQGESSRQHSEGRILFRLHYLLCAKMSEANNRRLQSGTFCATMSRANNR